MNLGKKLLELRKSKHLSQEEVAEKLNVTRQTISKWETDQSTPDFDKIIPLCELYEITADELLKGETSEKSNTNLGNSQVEDDFNLSKIRAKYIGISVLLYILSPIWIMISVAEFKMNPVIAVSIFLLIIGIATCLLIYSDIVYPKKETEKEKKEKALFKRIENILSLITLIIYLLISFISQDWHITWIIWIVFALVCEIAKLILSVKEDNDEQ